MWKLRAVNDELVRLYEVDGLSMLQLARRFGVSRQGIHHRLKRQGIRIRPQGRPRPKIDELTLRSLYLDQKLSGREIAIRFNVTQRAVYYWLKAFNIKSRGPGYYRKYPELANLQVGESMHAQELSKLGSSKGGKTITSKMTPKQLSDRARKAAQSRWKPTN